MRWFRQHVRQGSWLALIAFAINIAVAFGHVHGFGGTTERSGVLIAAVSCSDTDQNRHHPSDRHPDDLCPICMAATAMGNALTSAAPTLPVEFAATRIDQAIDPFYFSLQPPRAAFQSRGPPIS